MTTTETQTWFDLTAKDNFEKHLVDQRRCLQLGCFAGDATVWMLEHLSAQIVDVDTFEGNDEHGGIDMDYVRAVYDERTDGFDRVLTKVGETQDFLKRLDPWFDFIYIDADHHAAAVLADAVMSWPLLESGGLMAFDDYTWHPFRATAYETPQAGINGFLLAYGDQLDVIERNAQLWVRKR